MVRIDAQSEVLSGQRPFCQLGDFLMSEDSNRENVQASAPSDQTPRRLGGTRVLWVWLAFAAIISLFGSPPDPFCMFLAIQYGLISFLVGVCLASGWPLAVRVLAFAVWCYPTAIPMWGRWSTDGPGFAMAVVAVAYGVLSVAAGFAAFRSLRSLAGYRRILAGFAAGYALGAVFVIPFFVGPILGVFFAKRSIDVTAAKRG
jgi:hypothetical protein